MGGGKGRRMIRRRDNGEPPGTVLDPRNRTTEVTGGREGRGIFGTDRQKQESWAQVGATKKWKWKLERTESRLRTEPEPLIERVTMMEMMRASRSCSGGEGRGGLGFGIFDV